MGNTYESDNHGAKLAEIASTDHIVNIDSFDHLSNKFANELFKEWLIMRKYRSRYKYPDLDYRIASNKSISSLDWDSMNNRTLYKIKVDIYDINEKKLTKDHICDIDSIYDFEAKDLAIETISKGYLGGQNLYRNADTQFIKALYREVGIDDITDSPYISILKKEDKVYGFYLIDMVDRIAINFNKYLYA